MRHPRRFPTTGSFSKEASNPLSLPLPPLLLTLVLLSSLFICSGMIIRPASVESRLVFFLVQAGPSVAVLFRLFRTSPRVSPPPNTRALPFDGLVFLLLSLLLLLDLFYVRPILKPEWIAFSVAAAAAHALILSAEYSPYPEVRRFGLGILSPPRSSLWLVVSLLGFPVVFAVGHALGSLVPALAGPAYPFPAFPGGRSPVNIPLIFVTNAVFGGGIGGEPFWRGLLYVRFRCQSSLFPAALVTGLFQAVWFIPGWLLAGIDSRGILLLSALFLAISPAIAWVYERSGRSLLAAIVMFGSMTTSLYFIPLTAVVLVTTVLVVPATLFFAGRTGASPIKKVAGNIAT